MAVVTRNTSVCVFNDTITIVQVPLRKRRPLQIVHHYCHQWWCRPNLRFLVNVPSVVPLSFSRGWRGVCLVTQLPPPPHSLWPVNQVMYTFVMFLCTRSNFHYFFKESDGWESVFFVHTPPAGTFGSLRIPPPSLCKRTSRPPLKNIERWWCLAEYAEKKRINN